MPKTLVNGFRDQLSLAGLTNKHEGMLNQPVRTFDDVTFNNIISTGNLHVTGSVRIDGNVSEIKTEVLEIKDNIVQLNHGTTAPLLNGGFVIERGPNLDPFQILYNEDRQRLMLGFPDSMQSVATREADPLHQGVSIWDASANMFKTTYAYPRDFTFDSNLTVGSDIFLGQAGSISVLASGLTNSNDTIAINAKRITLNTGASPGGGIFTYGAGFSIEGRLSVNGTGFFETNLYVAGRLTVDTAVTTVSSLNVSNQVNAASLTMSEPVIVATNDLRTLYLSLQVTPTEGLKMVQMSIALPERGTEFATRQSILNATCSGYVDDVNLITLCNCLCVAQPDTKNVLVKFQAVNTNTHYLQVTVTYDKN